MKDCMTWIDPVVPLVQAVAGQALALNWLLRWLSFLDQTHL